MASTIEIASAQHIDNKSNSLSLSELISLRDMVVKHVVCDKNGELKSVMKFSEEERIAFKERLVPFLNAEWRNLAAESAKLEIKRHSNSCFSEPAVLMKDRMDEVEAVILFLKSEGPSEEVHDANDAYGQGMTSLGGCLCFAVDMREGSVLNRMRGALHLAKR